MQDAIGLDRRDGTGRKPFLIIDILENALHQLKLGNAAVINKNGPGAVGSLYAANGRRKYLTPEERARFIAAAESCKRPELRTLCLTLVYTGCRISEALALTAGGIERDCGFIAIRCLKKRSGNIVIRELPVPPSLLDALTRGHGLADAAPDARLWTLSRCRA